MRVRSTRLEEDGPTFCLAIFDEKWEVSLSFFLLSLKEDENNLFEKGIKVSLSFVEDREWRILFNLGKEREISGIWKVPRYAGICKSPL